MTDPKRKPTAADTWDRAPIEDDQFEMLWDFLDAHPEYEVRPALQVSHEDSALVKTIETATNSDETLGELKYRAMAGEPPFEKLTPELEAVLEKHDIEQSDLLMGAEEDDEDV